MAKKRMLAWASRCNLLCDWNCSGTRSETNRGRRAGLFLFICLMFVISVGPVYAEGDIQSGIPLGSLDIVASARQTEADRWQLTGRVRWDGAPVAGAEVWAVAFDADGNEYSPPGVTADSDGGFELQIVPTDLGADSGLEVTKVVLHAKAMTGPDEGAFEVRGKKVLVFDEDEYLLQRFKSRWLIVVAGAIFLLSIVLASVSWRPNSLYVKYLVSLTLAVLFTVMTIWWIAAAMYEVNSVGLDGDPPKLGIVNIYRGTFVEGVEKEWLVSFTEARKSSEGDKSVVVQDGMGAPLWVILLSVMGAALFTIILVIEAITDRPKFEAMFARVSAEEEVVYKDLVLEEKEREANQGEWDNAKRDREWKNEKIKWNMSIRNKVQVIVRHQFFILFAPIGAIFIYQMLVVSSTASNQLTVALASLASGVTPYWLLNKALTMVRSILEAKESQTHQSKSTAT